jgi:hypothetical protein
MQISIVRISSRRYTISNDGTEVQPRPEIETALTIQSETVPFLAMALEVVRRARNELSRGENCTVAQREIKWHNKSMKMRSVRSGLRVREN